MRAGRARRLTARLFEIAALVCLGALCLWAYFLYSTPAAETVASDEAAPLEITMIDVGQGLSILIGADGEYMLYDGGGHDAADRVAACLGEHGVEELCYVVASHFDEDHIGGLIGVLAKTGAQLALIPGYEADTPGYASFMRALSRAGADKLSPAAGDSFTLGTASFQVVSPVSYDSQAENDSSIAIRIVYGDYSAIITGDAGYTAEAQMLASGLTLSSDLYIVGHHGSRYSSTADFIDAVDPSYAFLSVGTPNDFGHPSDQVLETLKDHRVALFRTDVDGTVSFRSDGVSCWFSAAPSNDYTPGRQAREALTSSSKSVTTVACTATGKRAYYSSSVQLSYFR